MFHALRSLVLMASLATLAGCGSGIAAIFANDSGSRSAPPPGFALSQGETVPLIAPRDTRLSIRVQNYELPPRGEGVTVELRALGVVKVFNVFSLRPNEITFGYSALEVANKVADQTKTDVPGLFAVLVDGVEIAPPIPVLLLRQPSATVDGGRPRIELSPFGDAVAVRLKSVVYELPTTPHPAGSAKYTEAFLNSNPDMSVRYALGYTGTQLEDQHSTSIRSVAPQTNGDLLVTVAMPAVDHPTQVHVVIDSMPSGASNLVSNLYYRPAARVVSPSIGASEGGTPVILFGKAFVPHDPADQSKLLWDRLAVEMRKGGRKTQLDDIINRDLSTTDRLVFSIPPAPDGRPGPATIHIAATIGRLGLPATTEVVTTATDVFTFGDTFPYFGPRGVLLREEPVVTAMAPFVDTASKVADGFSVTSGPVGMPFLSVLHSRGNGVLTRFGQPLRAGLVFDSLQRNPVGICIADFIGNRTRSGVILNGGNNGVARHGLVVGTEASNPPVSYDENFQLGIEQSGRACASGDFNGDGISDLVVLSNPLPNQTSSTPVVFVSSGSPSQPKFDRKPFSSYAATPFDFTAVDVADLDGDGDADLVFAAGGLSPRLLIAYGSGDGLFRAANVLDLDKGGFDLATLGYTPHKDSRAVRVHAMYGSGRPTVAVVFRGVAGSTKSPPMVVNFRPGATNRTFAALRATDLLKFPGPNRLFVGSTVSPLRAGGPSILAVAAAGDAAEPIRLFELGLHSVLEPLPGSVTLGPNPIGKVLDIHADVAVAAGSFRHPNGRYAVYLTHQESIGGRVESRISTFLAGAKGRTISAPSASRVVDDKITGVTLGRFFAGTSGVIAMDAWLAVPSGLRRATNDGLGELSVASSTVTATSLLPASLATVSFGSTQARVQDIPAVLTRDGRLGVVLPGDPTKIVYAGGAVAKDLREYAPAARRDRVVQPNSVICSADIDGDGWSDLVAMVSLSIGVNQGDERESMLLLFRGIANPKTTGFPYSLPTSKPGASYTHGNATSLAIGDFAPATTNSALEIAVALPEGRPFGNEVRFYHWAAGTASFERSFVSENHNALLVGREPYQITAGDFNSDGRTDIAVASRLDHNLWVYHNGSTAGTTGKVDIKRFVGAPANPMALPAGTPERMISQDINGDAVPDVTVLLKSGTTTENYQVAYYLNPGRLRGTGVRVVSGERSGNIVFAGNQWILRDSAGSLGLGDLNGDGAPDLLMGWHSAGAKDHNLRVLFSNNF